MHCKLHRSALLLTSTLWLTAGYSQELRVREPNGTGFRNTDTASVYINYTIGDPIPAPETYTITSTGGTPVNVNLMVQQGTLHWLQATLSSPQTPTLVSIGLSKNDIPPVGSYQGTVSTTGFSNTLSWFVFLTVNPARPSQFHTNEILSHLACGDTWSTSVYLTNTIASPAVVGLNIVGDDGKPLLIGSSSRRTLTLPGHGSESVDFNREACGILKTGYITTNIGDGVTGYAVFRQTIPGAQEQEAVVQLMMPTNGTTMIYDETKFVTAVALANASPTVPNTIMLTAYSPTGAYSSFYTLVLGPGEKKAFVVKEKMALSAKGSLSIQSTTIPFTGLGLRFNGLAFTSIPLR